MMAGNLITRSGNANKRDRSHTGKTYKMIRQYNLYIPICAFLEALRRRNFNWPVLA